MSIRPNFRRRLRLQLGVLGAVTSSFDRQQVFVFADPAARLSTVAAVATTAWPVAQTAWRCGHPSPGLRHGD